MGLNPGYLLKSFLLYCFFTILPICFRQMLSILLLTMNIFFGDKNIDFSIEDQQGITRKNMTFSFIFSCFHIHRPQIVCQKLLRPLKLSIIYFCPLHCFFPQKIKCTLLAIEIFRFIYFLSHDRIVHPGGTQYNMKCFPYLISN